MADGMMDQGYTIAVLAGEASGDQLGGTLCTGLTSLLPKVRLEGVGGPHMAQAGCQLLAHVDELSVMGLAEVVAHLPRLLRLRRDLLHHWQAKPPDCFIGIDAPDFNLPIAKRLKQRGVPTIHYVAPTAWAWRQGRAKRLAKAVDRLLVLFPFEEAFFGTHVTTRFVGHPLAEQPLGAASKTEARAWLQRGAQRTLAILPGSRWEEVRRMTPIFFDAALWLHQQEGQSMHVLLPAARCEFVPLFHELAGRRGLAIEVVPAERVSLALQAADAALVTCGTATLQAALAGCPFVAGYRMSPWSYHLLRASGMVKTPFFALPNILLGELVVPEFIQPGPKDGPKLGHALREVMLRGEVLRSQFAALRETLQGKRHAAAVEVLSLLKQGRSHEGGRT